MSRFAQEPNDLLAQMILGLKSPTSVAKAYKQYLSDKNEIMSKMMSAISSGIAQESIARSTTNDIVVESGLSIDKVILTPEGDFVKLVDFINNLKVTLDQGPTTMEGAVFNTEVDVLSTLDDLVDSYQVSQIFESTFAVLEVQDDSVTASLADVSERINRMGLELSQNASNVLVTVGDIMSDRTGGLIEKISSITSLLTQGTDGFDDDGDSHIQMPDFGKDGYNGASPFLSMLQDVDIDISSPIPAIVSGIKSAAKTTKRFFNWTKKVVGKGWNAASQAINKTFIDPVDFVVIDEKAESNMVDVPIIDFRFTIKEYEDQTRNAYFPGYRDLIKRQMLKMRIGSMRSTYSPFSVTNLVRENENSFRLVVHIIPTSPISTNEHIPVPEFGFTSSGFVIYDAQEDFNLTEQFDKWVMKGVSSRFTHTGDDDGYYLSAVASSMYRLRMVTTLALLIGLEKDIKWWGVQDMTIGEIMAGILQGNEKLSGENALPNDFAKAVGGSLSIDSGVEENWSWLNEGVIQVMKNPVTGNQVTNSQFIELMSPTNINVVTIFGFLNLLFMNSFEYMETFFRTQPEVPAFVPSLIENTYQAPMYSINDDSKNGQRVSKMFKGIAITAVVVVGSVIVVKAALSVKRSMKMASFALAGQQRRLENMDPSDPNYVTAFKDWKKQSKKFNKKNKFLSMVGLGAKKSASDSLSGFSSIEDFIPSNDDVLSLLK